MKKTLCYSVRVKELKDISPKAVVITTFDGKEDIFPKSQLFGQDNSVKNSEAFWISEWILKNKNIQYSTSKKAWL